jgi:hypothetical protein
VDIGTTLNHALDDLWFTILFKRRDFAHANSTATERAQAVDLYLRARTVGLHGNLNASEQTLMHNLTAELAPQGSWLNGADQNAAAALVQSVGKAPTRWGWKEPNTQVFLHDLDMGIPGLRYIHIMRSGVDMAFSGNTNQLQLWSRQFGLPDDPDTPTPVRQLRYWIASNRRVLDYGRERMAGRFMAIRYEAFCAHPEVHWAHIAHFIGAPDGLELPNELVRPTTIGRGRKQDHSLFDANDLKAVRALESELENAPVVA